MSQPRTPPEQPTLQPLPPPRRLTPAERDFVRWLARQELRKWEREQEQEQSA